MDYKEVCRIKFQYLLQSEKYLLLNSAYNKWAEENDAGESGISIAEDWKLRHHNSSARPPNSDCIGLFRYIDKMDRKEIFQFYHTMRLFLFFPWEEFDDIWNNIIMLYEINQSGDVLNIIDSFQFTKSIFTEAYAFYTARNGINPTYVDIIKYLEFKCARNNKSRMFIEIPLSLRKDTILNSVEKLVDENQKSINEYDFREFLGINGNIHLEKLKLYLGVYILRTQFDISRRDIIRCKFDKDHEIFNVVYSEYNGKNDSNEDNINLVKIHTKKAKGIICALEQGFFPSASGA